MFFFRYVCSICSSLRTIRRFGKRFNSRSREFLRYVIGAKKENFEAARQKLFADEENGNPMWVGHIFPGN